METGLIQIQIQIQIYAEPCPGVTVAYVRDRDDALRPATRASIALELLRKAPCVPFAYIMEGGEWMLYLNGQPVGRSLAEALVGIGG